MLHDLLHPHGLCFLPGPSHYRYSGHTFEFLSGKLGTGCCTYEDAYPVGLDPKACRRVLCSHHDGAQGLGRTILPQHLHHPRTVAEIRHLWYTDTVGPFRPRDGRLGRRHLRRPHNCP